jgi:dCTP deaminase
MTVKHYVRFDGRFILHPRSFVLATTLEWIRMPRTLAGYVTGKSSWGRRGLVIETAPGVHPGFIGCLTLELANVGEIPIEIYPGTPICQLFFHRVEGDTSRADQSAFVGRRQPVLGHVRLDDFSKKLRIDR